MVYPHRPYTPTRPLQEYIACSSGDPHNGVVRQQGLVGGLFLGLGLAMFFRSRASGMALVKQLKMPPPS